MRLPTVDSTSLRHAGSRFSSTFASSSHASVSTLSGFRTFRCPACPRWEVHADTQRGYTARIHSADTQRGYAARIHSADTQRVSIRAWGAPASWDTQWSTNVYPKSGNPPECSGYTMVDHVRAAVRRARHARAASTPTREERRLARNASPRGGPPART